MARGFPFANVGYTGNLSVILTKKRICALPAARELIYRNYRNYLWMKVVVREHDISLPSITALVWISGVAEIAGGLGIVQKATRRIAGWGLIALLIAVFPANIYAALHGMEISGGPVPDWMLWARLPLQAVLVAWVVHAMRTTPDT